MRRALFALTGIFSVAAWGGPIAEDFGSGYGGVKWGMPLATVVAMLPDGEHRFSAPDGARIYSVRNDQPFLGVPRAGTSVRYHFGNSGVDSIAVGIPYERCEQMLDVLVSHFGNYRLRHDNGQLTYFLWAEDHNTVIGLRMASAPQFGIAEVWIATK